MRNHLKRNQSTDLSRTGVVVLFSTLPMVGGNSTITLRLAGRFRDQGLRVVVVAKEMSGIGYCANTLAELARLGCIIQKWPLGGAWHLPRLLWALVAEVSSDRCTFVAVGMRWGAVLLAAAVRFDSSWFYMIQHDKELGPIRLFGPCIRVFDGIGMISTESIEPARRKLDGGLHIAWLPQFSGTGGRGGEAAQSARPARAFGFLGQLTESKGIQILLELWRRYPGLPRLIVMGDGPLRTEVEAASVKTGGHIDYRGGFTATESGRVLPLFFRDIEALLVPITKEGDGIPTVILEALSYGVPTLCTDLGGLGAFRRALRPQMPDVVEAVPLQQFAERLQKWAVRSVDRASVSDHCKAYYAAYFADDTVQRRWAALLVPDNFVI